jgi:hypothetical protein
MRCCCSPRHQGLLVSARMRMRCLHSVLVLLVRLHLLLSHQIAGY